MQSLTEPAAGAPAGGPAAAAGPGTETDLVPVAEALAAATSWLRRALRPAEWNAVALSTLDAVDRTGPHRISFLVTQERITQPGMTGIVDRLAAAGLVRRQPDPADGRAALVAITPAGHDYLMSIRRQRAATVAAHIGSLEPGHQQALAAAAAALQALAACPVSGTAAAAAGTGLAGTGLAGLPVGTA
jgi:DNA-binding MarR family transcriptional regulator